MIPSAQARPRVLILGTGAMASTVGAHLAREASTDVTLAGTWREAVETIRRDGVRVDDGSDSWVGRPAAVVIHETPVADVALVLLKSTQSDSPATAKALRRAMRDGGVVVTLQNGLGNREVLESIVGQGRVGVGVLTLGATLIGPGHVRVFAGDAVLAHEGTSQMRSAIEGLAEILTRAGLPASTTADLLPLVWSKLAVNCAINPLAALTGLTNGALLESPRLRALMLRAALEVGEVARARGLSLPDDPSAKTEAVAMATASNRSSMLQDLTRGVPTEIDFLCGAVASEAARLHVPVPVNQWLWRSVRARETAIGVRRRLSA